MLNFVLGISAFADYYVKKRLHTTCSNSDIVVYFPLMKDSSPETSGILKH